MLHAGNVGLGTLLVLIGTIIAGGVAFWGWFDRPARPWPLLFFISIAALFIGAGVLIG